MNSQENNSKFVTFLYFTFVAVLRHFLRDLKYIPKVDFNLLEALLEKRVKESVFEPGAKDSVNSVDFWKPAKLGDYSALNFPPLISDLVSFVERLPFIGDSDFDQYEESSESEDFEMLGYLDSEDM